MARDDEFRKVAEDIGALARSLGRDFRDAVDQSLRRGHPPGRAVRHGLRGLGDDARRGVRSTWPRPPGRRRGRPWSPWEGPGWGAPPWAPPPGRPPRGGDPGTGYPGPGDPGSAPSNATDDPPPRWDPTRPWAGPRHHGRHRSGPPWTAPARREPRRRRDPLPPVRHRWDASTVIGLLAVLFGVAWLIGATGALHVSIEGVVAVGLMLLGASLVVTGRTDWSLSRRSWPVWLGAALIAVLMATSSTFGVNGALDSVSFGNKSVTVSSPPSGVIHGGFGNLTVDISSVPQAEPVKVVSVAGDTTVNLPPNATGTVDARVAAGQICVGGRAVARGPGAHYHGSLPTTAKPGPHVTLDVHQVFGQILIDGQGCNR